MQGLLISSDKKKRVYDNSYIIIRQRSNSSETTTSKQSIMKNERSVVHSELFVYFRLYSFLSPFPVHRQSRESQRPHAAAKCIDISDIY